MQSVTIAGWKVLVSQELPLIHDAYCENASLVETFEDDGASKVSFLAIGREDRDWPQIVINQRYVPAGCLTPGVLVVPESRRAFVGAGERLLCYDLDRPARLWEDVAHFGFWAWRRTQDHVVMAAELECAAWTIKGEKLWSEPVEPPWAFEIEGGAVVLDVMGQRRTINLKDGK